MQRTRTKTETAMVFVRAASPAPTSGSTRLLAALRPHATRGTAPSLTSDQQVIRRERAGPSRVPRTLPPRAPVPTCAQVRHTWLLPRRSSATAAGVLACWSILGPAECVLSAGVSGSDRATATCQQRLRACPEPAVARESGDRARLDARERCASGASACVLKTETNVRCARERGCVSCRPTRARRGACGEVLGRCAVRVYERRPLRLRCVSCRQPLRVLVNSSRIELSQFWFF